MSEAHNHLSAVSERAAQESLIESFGIRGLYGYRTIGLQSDHAATILIAKNGTGKTTLLGALDAFLRLQFARLKNLQFQEIYCKLRMSEDTLVLTHDDVDAYLQVPTDGELVRVAARSGLDPATLFKFIVEEWSPSYYDTDNKVYSTLMSAYSYKYEEISATLTRLRQLMLHRQPNISSIAQHISAALGEYDIVYLPTYRRVELPLMEDPKPSPYRRRRRPKFNIDSGGLFTGDIQFGLSDIAERLSSLNQKIIVESNNGYREISANIINELIDGALEDAVVDDAEIPTEEELRLFFSRLEESRRVGPYLPVTTPDLDKLYAGEGIAESSKEFLRYFLSKLNTVIKASKEVESPVDSFIIKCNKYLSSVEPSTVLEERGQQVAPDLDSKALCLNRTNLEVHVESVPDGRKISLDALSSGEKQMVSLFAKLFLYPKNKIVLIDEPELSLSIDWQAQILVDVITAPLCRQVVAITHSPFVFDNDLEPFAKSLDVTLAPRPDVEIPDFVPEEEPDEDD